MAASTGGTQVHSSRSLFLASSRPLVKMPPDPSLIPHRPSCQAVSHPGGQEEEREGGAGHGGQGHPAAGDRSGGRRPGGQVRRRAQGVTRGWRGGRHRQPCVLVKHRKQGNLAAQGERASLQAAVSVQRCCWTTSLTFISRRLLPCEPRRSLPLPCTTQALIAAHEQKQAALEKENKDVKSALLSLQVRVA